MSGMKKVFGRLELILWKEYIRNPVLLMRIRQQSSL